LYHAQAKNNRLLRSTYMTQKKHNQGLMLLTCVMLAWYPTHSNGMLPREIPPSCRIPTCFAKPSVALRFLYDSNKEISYEVCLKCAQHWLKEEAASHTPDGVPARCCVCLKRKALEELQILSQYRKFMSDDRLCQSPGTHRACRICIASLYEYSAPCPQCRHAPQRATPVTRTESPEDFAWCE